MKKKSPSQSAPAGRSLGERGFFNLRVLVGLFIALAGVFLALLVLGFYPAKSGFAQALLSASDSPEEEDPGERAAWERLRLQDEHGRIPPNALINAYEQKKAMSFHPEAWGEFLPGGATTQGIQPEIAGIRDGCCGRKERPIAKRPIKGSSAIACASKEKWARFISRRRSATAD